MNNNDTDTLTLGIKHIQDNTGNRNFSESSSYLRIDGDANDIVNITKGDFKTPVSLNVDGTDYNLRTYNVGDVFAEVLIHQDISVA